MKKNQPLHDVRQIDDLREMLRGSVKEYADKTVFLTKPEIGKPYVPVTYARYGNDIEAFGSKLTEMGVVNDVRVAILAETRYEWYVTYLATVTGMGVIVPLDKELPANEINSMLQRSKTSVLVYSPTLREKALEAAEGLATLKTLILMDNYKNEVEPFTSREVGEDLPPEYSWEALRKDGEQLLADGYRDFSDCEIDPYEMRILLFTSGTTARSKAVMHSHHSICSNLMAMCAMVYINDDVCLSVLPLHHTYECTCGFLCQVYRGNAVAELEGLRYLTQNLAESKTTLILTVPLILEALHKRIWKSIDKQGKRKKVEFALKLTRGLRKIGIDLRKKIFKDIHAALGGHMRLLISGGAAIDPQVLQDLNDFGFLAIQGYGLTECGPIMALNRDVNFMHESAGLPMPGTVAEVYEPDEDGIGEFRSKGPNIMLGYYGDEELTAETLRDGWFYTGDYGYMTEDNFLIITGRKKNVIVTKNGKNIFPEELEALLNRNPEIAESVVSGVEGRNGDLDIVVEIFPDEEEVQETLGKQSVTEEETYELINSLVKELNKDQPIYKKIKSVTLRDEPFVKNTSKKIIRDYSK
ncbi:MAG: AMP-binding protein [Saccharofermentanales bacterium]